MQTLSKYDVTDHLAKPGPLYWSERCLECSHDVRDHAPWWAYLLRKLRGK